MSGRYPSSAQMRLWRECLRKKLYKTRDEAEWIFTKLPRKERKDMHIYACPRAAHFHIGHINKRAVEIVH
jgi:hypothetical protein